ncbi:hypothetical protein ABT404_09950 [Streptomyces hyaluromycini]|uniref:Uncharacterized protein n=1 Tax=Streptomyces hyaluromycini TaxID=1377993 RepID=A0ABV1WSF3_9ACTN
MRLAAEAISKVTRQGQEVLLITGSDAVKAAVRSYVEAMTANNPSAARSGHADSSEQRYALFQRMTQSQNQFVVAARAELRILSSPHTSTDTSG